MTATIKPYAEFRFWFNSHFDGTTDVIDPELSDRVARFETDAADSLAFLDTVDPDMFTESEIEQMKSEFDEYKTSRPESWMRMSGGWLRAIVDGSQNFELPQIFDGLVRAVNYTECHDDEKAERLSLRFLDWIHGTDFFTAPASTIYHDSEESGLVRHTLKVVAAALDLLNTDHFHNVSQRDAILVALVHDLCKIDFYESYMKNVKNEQTGVWEKVLAYRCKGSSIPLGHGVTSMFIAQKFFKLSVEQALAIRWHMGEHNLADNESHDLMDANENYPLVMLLQTADRMAIMQK